MLEIEKNRIEEVSAYEFVVDCQTKRKYTKNFKTISLSFIYDTNWVREESSVNLYEKQYSLTYLIP